MNIVRYIFRYIGGDIMHPWSKFIFGRLRHSGCAVFPEWAAGGRHGHHGRGGGRGWPGDWGGMGDEGGPFTRGRKFGADDLQLMLLALIEERPSHGYELIKELESRSNGFYSPSPGMVYPALTYLEELDYATVQAEGNRKRYHVAPAGQAHLLANRDRVQLLFAGLSHMARKMAWMKRAWSGEGNDGADAADAEKQDGWLPDYVAARRALKMALLRRSDAPADEQRRIAAILQRATAEILDGAAQ
jgi:DNA-binding PadR family transcriptional regulator